MTKDQIKPNLNKPVKYNGRIYTLKEYILWYDKIDRSFKHSCTLQDDNNTVIRAKLELVEPVIERS